MAPPGLRILGVKRTDPNAPLHAASDAGSPISVEGRTEPLFTGQRVEADQRLHVDEDFVVVLRSAIEGLELELVGPATMRITAVETIYLYDGLLRVSAAPRAPATVATPDAFVFAPAGAAVTVRDHRSKSGSEGTTVEEPEGAPGAIQATGADGAWQKTAIGKSKQVSFGAASTKVRASLDRCRAQAARARAAWDAASSKGTATDKAPATGVAEAGSSVGDLWAAQTEARGAARGACAVARLLVEKQGPKESPLFKEVDAADQLWQALPSGDAGAASR